MAFQVKQKKLKEKKHFEVDKKQEPVNVRGHYYSWEENNGKVDISLGNMSDAGWYWDGDQKSFISFLHRIKNSKTTDTFLQDTKNVDFDKKVKPYLYESAKEKDGLYEMSGDNRRWHFGQSINDDMNVQEEYGLTEKQVEKFYDEYQGNSYEEFQKEYGKEYQQDIDKAIKESHNFEQFMEKTDELKEKYNGLADEEELSNAYDTAEKVKRKKK